jgi:bifunctional ADP-heptose synthase (sugar kinase/adenylyltransferase)
VAVLGVFGQDGFGVELARALEARGISAADCPRAPDFQTFTYTKVLNGETGVEDRPRLDFINTAPLEPAIERRILDALQNSFDSYDAILLSDQAETSQGGVVTPAVRELVAELAPHYPEKVVLADSRARIRLFRNVIIKPNRQEAEEASMALFGRVDFEALRAHTAAPLMAVTHGAEGVDVVAKGAAARVPTRPVENPVDICGAGDSFSAGFAMALSATRSPVEAARFGNLVASVTIMKKGTGAASPEELLAAAADA